MNNQTGENIKTEKELNEIHYINLLILMGIVLFHGDSTIISFMMLFQTSKEAFPCVDMTMKSLTGLPPESDKKELPTN